MVRKLAALAATVLLALPTLATAEEQHHSTQSHPPGPHGPPPGAHPRFAGPHGPNFTWRGHDFHRVHVAPFVYPHGWGYRRWGIGMMLPPLFLAPAYFYADWAAMGLPPPDPGFQWVRYGPDLLLVNVATGQVVDVIYGAFY